MTIPERTDNQMPWVSETQRDLLRDTLRSSLRHSFLVAGYKDDEACKLVEIAIGPVHHALELAHAAYKLHIEAINIQPTGFVRRL